MLRCGAWITLLLACASLCACKSGELRRGGPADAGPADAGPADAAPADAAPPPWRSVIEDLPPPVPARAVDAPLPPTRLLLSGQQRIAAVATAGGWLYVHDAGARTLARAPLAGGPLELLASNLPDDGALPPAHEGAALVWRRAGEGGEGARPAGDAVYLRQAAGGRPPRLAPVAPAPGQPRALALGRGWVAWVSYQGAVMRAPRKGGAPRLLAHAARGIASMARSGDELAWINFDDGTVNRAAADGGEAAVVARLPARPRALAAAGDDVLVAAGATLWRVPLAGGPPAALASFDGEARAVVVAEDAAVVAVVDAHGRAAILRVPLAGGAVLPLVTGLGAVDELATSPDGAWVYWLAQQAQARHALGRVALAGGPVETLATSLLGPASLVVAGGWVYLALSDGAIVRLPAAGGTFQYLAGPGRNVGALAVDAAAGELYVASGGTLAGGWKDGVILRATLR